MTFGLGPFGGAPYGGSGGGFSVVSAQAVNPFTVVVQFSSNVAGTPVTFDPTNYVITGPSITIVQVVPDPDPSKVRLITSEQAYSVYDLTVLNVQDVFGTDLDPLADSAGFTGWPDQARFTARAIGPSAIQVLFAQPMSPTPALLATTSYTVTDLQGTPVSVLTVAPNQTTHVLRMRLNLGSPITPGKTYALHVSSTIVTDDGKQLLPNDTTVVWHQPSYKTSIAISRFTGEVRTLTPPKDRTPTESLTLKESLTLVVTRPTAVLVGGVEILKVQEKLTILPEQRSGLDDSTAALFGQPKGQVFFSPSLVPGGAPNSSIQVDNISVCTRAYDVYTFPQPVDPIPLFTYGGGLAGSVLGAGTVLFTNFYRLGEAKHDLTFKPKDVVVPPVDIYASFKLVQQYDPSRFSLLNDPSGTWGLGPTWLNLPFTTADNLHPVVSNEPGTPLFGSPLALLGTFPLGTPPSSSGTITKIYQFLNPAEYLTLTETLDQRAAIHVAVAEAFGFTENFHAFPGLNHHIIALSESVVFGEALHLLP